MEDLDENNKESLREQQGALIKLVGAFADLEGSKEWQIIKEQVHTPTVARIERQILNEAQAPIIDVDKIYRLQGELAWARRFSDINKFAETLKRQLEDIKNKLK
jgi:hypothetical protein